MPKGDVPIPVICNAQIFDLSLGRSHGVQVVTGPRRRVDQEAAQR